MDKKISDLDLSNGIYKMDDDCEKFIPHLDRLCKVKDLDTEDKFILMSLSSERKTSEEGYNMAIEVMELIAKIMKETKCIEGFDSTLIASIMLESK